MSPKGAAEQQGGFGFEPPDVSTEYPNLLVATKNLMGETNPACESNRQAPTQSRTSSVASSNAASSSSTSSKFSQPERSKRLTSVQRQHQAEEARIHRLVAGHPSVVSDSDTCGCDLWSYLVEGEPEPHFSTDAAKLSWSIQLTSGLQHIHSRNVMLRGLSPWAIVTQPNLRAQRGLSEGVPPHLKIGDFGLALQVGPGVALPLRGTAALASTDGTHSRPMALDASAMNSPYLAPELGKEYDFSADIFSLGMVLFLIWDFDASRCQEEVKLRVEHLKATGEFPVDFKVRPRVCNMLRCMLSATRSKRPCLSKVRSFFLSEGAHVVSPTRQ